MQQFIRLIILVAMVFSLWGCGDAPPEPAPRSTTIHPDLLRNFHPAAEAMEADSNPLTEAKIALGRALYYDGRLSKSGSVSCNSCHPLDRYGVDGKPVSTGHNGLRGSRNAPTVYFAAAHAVQFWDGRAADVEAQASGPILNPVEMAMAGAAEVEARLRSIPEYAAMFRRAFPRDKQPVTLENAARAIGAFERKLVTPGSRWDRYLAGDRQALTDDEKAGFVAFYQSGCQACHNGTYLGGRMFQKVGLMKPWPNQKDQGRFAFTRREYERMVFKVPSLRNVARTGPYFHDGSVDSLEQAVRMMGEYQMERPLTDTEVKDIVAWLRSLTGELPLDYIRRPDKLPGESSD